ncbi:hypothetical protein [Bdellovibrio sp. HCB-110]|uniref:hypothetical protein n=1 Tax=Bdellovibrio sp. HCB-110 TaxID=3391182 RepID=UPI0039B66E3E
MKTLLSLLITLAAANASANIYDCSGGSFEPLTVEVLNQKEVLLNGKEKGTVDFAYAKKNPEKKSYSILGFFPESLAAGADGFSVDVTISKYMFAGSKVAYLNTYNRGPEGFYSESYKCIKR